MNADLQVIIKLVAIRTSALITANRIDASIISARRRVAFVLVDALVVIEMLNESVRTAATIASHKVLTAMLARRVIGAFVMIRAESPR